MSMATISSTMSRFKLIYSVYLVSVLIEQVNFYFFYLVSKKVLTPKKNSKSQNLSTNKRSLWSRVHKSVLDFIFNNFDLSCPIDRTRGLLRWLNISTSVESVFIIMEQILLQIQFNNWEILVWDKSKISWTHLDLLLIELVTTKRLLCRMWSYPMVRLMCFVRALSYNTLIMKDSA